MKKYYPIALISLLLLVAAYVLYAASDDLTKSDKTDIGSLPLIKSQEMFFQAENYLSAIDQTDPDIFRDDIYAIIVPHHLLVSQYISQMLSLAKGREIDKIIIIGPNHTNTGGDSISSTVSCWETEIKRVCSSRALTTDLINTIDIRDNRSAFTHEHSIGAIVPFIAHHYPKAEIIPISIMSDTSLNDVAAVSDWISSAADKKTLIVASIDFSHYLSKFEANKKDEVTKKLINNKDLDEIITLSNDYVDSPASLAVMLTYAEANNLETEFIDHSNSFDFMQLKPTETTSYFTIAFTK